MRLPGTGPVPKLTEPSEPLTTPAGVLVSTTEEMRQVVARLEQNLPPCPKCQEQGLTSTVQSLGTISTLLDWGPIVDDSGVEHQHDPNQYTDRYECSNGHFFEYCFHQPCPVCGPAKPEKWLKRQRPESRSKL
jgi:hypothetical protein